MPLRPVRSCRLQAATLLLLALLGACARLPAEQARGTPAEAVAARGFALLSLNGVPLGSAVAVVPDRLLTNAHVVPAGSDRIGFRRGDGAVEGRARLLARSDRMDLVVLQVPPGIFEPAPQAPFPPAQGERIWALGAPRIGAPVVSGRVLRGRTVLPGHGPGFTARLGALLGYSGGPALDEAGRLTGLVTALPRPGAAPLLAALSGVDLDGIVHGKEGREVFLLSITAANVEVDRLLNR